MAANRKLQAEIDRTLKKVQEGVDKWLASLPDLSFMLSDKLAVPAA